MHFSSSSLFFDLAHSSASMTRQASIFSITLFDAGLPSGTVVRSSFGGLVLCGPELKKLMELEIQLLEGPETAWAGLGCFFSEGESDFCWASWDLRVMADSTSDVILAGAGNFNSLLMHSGPSFASSTTRLTARTDTGALHLDDHRGAENFQEAQRVAFQLMEVGRRERGVGRVRKDAESLLLYIGEDGIPKHQNVLDLELAAQNAAEPPSINPPFKSHTGYRRNMGGASFLLSRLLYSPASASLRSTLLIL